MARPRQQSKVQIPPRIKGFMPIGHYTNASEIIVLNLEEYEVIRLLDYESLSQEQAAGFMQVSRPTLTRIYERARKKIAAALTEGRQVMIEGGRAIFEGEWYVCSHCKSRFNALSDKEVQSCPFCAAETINRIGI